MFVRSSSAAVRRMFYGLVCRVRRVSATLAIVRGCCGPSEDMREGGGGGGRGEGGRADCSEAMELGLFSDRWTTGQLIVLLLNLRM